MEIRTERVEVQAAAGAMPAHLAEPASGGPYPAVVVLMEAFGLNGHIEKVAERIAREGYVTIAPDLYYRELPDTKFGYDDLTSAIGAMGRLEHGDFVEDMGKVLDLLSSRSSVNADRIGVTGFCMGGLLTFLSACKLPDRVKAAAPFYGGGIHTLLDQADAIQAPLHLFFGERDAFIPLDQVKQIDAKLEELGKTYELETYSGAEHGFFCDERESHDAKAAAHAWGELTAFFAKNLGS